MKNPLFDSHAHLQLSQFDKDREEVIKRTEENNVWVVNVGDNFVNSKKGIELSKKYTNFFSSIGLHPNEKEEFNKEKYIPLLKEKKVVAIGECGLDYFRLKNEIEREKQKINFIKQIELSEEYNKPIILHIRSKENFDAYEEIIKIIKKFNNLKGIVHFFSADWNIAQEFLKLNFFISFSGIITFTKQYDEVISKIPNDKILSETDCPFASPEPFRGKRNEPIFVQYVIQRIAEIKEMKMEEMAENIFKNTKKIFKID
jgi:TatD DNase family protein